MGMNELHSIEVVLTYMDGEAVMLVNTPPTGDYDSGAEANEWINRARTGRCRAVSMTPIYGAGMADDAEVPHKPRCPMEGCVFEDAAHGLPHQDEDGEQWDNVDVLGNRVVIPATS